MFRHPAIVSTLVIVGLFVSADDCHSQSYEPLRTYRASAVVPKALRQGTGYRVAETVTTDGFNYHFRLITDYGDYEVHGLELLQERVRETIALNDLSRYTDSKVFQDAAKKAGVDILTAPVRAVGKLADTVSDPEAAWDTAKKVPAGVVGIFGKVTDAVSKGASKAAKAVSGSSDGEASSARSEIASEASTAAVDYGLDYIGYSASETKWYKQYGLDQYTTNKPLRDKIRRIAAIESAVNIGSKFVPGLGLLSTISAVNRYVDLAKRAALYASPEEIHKNNELRLQNLKIEQQLIDAFLKHPEYSPSDRAILVDGIAQMSGAASPEKFLQVAITAQSRDGARFYREMAQQLAEANAKSPVTAFLNTGRVAAVVQKSGTQLVILPLDCVLWRSELAESAASFKAQSEKNPAVTKRQIRVNGIFSERARTELRSRGAEVLER